MIRENIPKLHAHLQRFQLSLVKPKPEIITPTNHKGHRQYGEAIKT